MTRELIVDAFAEIVVEQGPRTFAMEDVAERAGVSLRTLYRYYPGREELVQALIDKLDETMTLNPEQLEKVGTLEGALDLVVQRMEFFSEHEKLARASLAMIAGTEGVSEERDDEPSFREIARQRATRHQGIRMLIHEEFEDLPPVMRDQLFAVVRTVGSMVGWGQMTGPAGGLSGRDAGIVTQWALQTLQDRARELMAQGVESFEDDL